MFLPRSPAEVPYTAPFALVLFTAMSSPNIPAGIVSRAGLLRLVSDNP
jgi:hypothetical protein